MQTILMIIFWCSAVQLTMAISIRPLLPIPTQPPTAKKTLRTIIPPTTTTTTTTTTRQNCPPSFDYLSQFNKCYLKFSNLITWTEANQTCIDNGARLAMPKSQSEIVFVQSLFYYNSIWLGATYRTINGTSDYYWLDDNTRVSFCRYILNTPYAAVPFVALYPQTGYCWINGGTSDLSYVVCERAPLP